MTQMFWPDGALVQSSLRPFGRLMTDDHSDMSRVHEAASALADGCTVQQRVAARLVPRAGDGRHTDVVPEP